MASKAVVVEPRAVLDYGIVILGPTTWNWTRTDGCKINNWRVVYCKL